jgi:1-acyl-sn-glycerol-3-phosphate acyltransferase
MGARSQAPSRSKILALLTEITGRGDGRLPDAGTRLSEIGFDSLCYAEFASAMLDRHGIDLRDGEPIELRTAGDVVGRVESAAAQHVPAAEGFPAGLGRYQGSVHRTIGGLIRWWFDLEVHGAGHMPRSGPVVLCMNHESLLDIPVAVVASPRPIGFMAKRELFRSRIGARFFHELGGFSVDRDRFDPRAVDVALRVMDRGEVLGMYPEGTRRPGVLLPFLPGAPWIALGAGAPLLPCAIAGTDAAMPPGRKVPKRVGIRVTFAEPIELGRLDDPVKRRLEAERLAEELHSVIGRLLARRPS